MSQDILLRVEIHCENCIVSHTNFRTPCSPFVYVSFTPDELSSAIAEAVSHLDALGWKTIGGRRFCEHCAYLFSLPVCPDDGCNYRGNTAYCPHHGCETVPSETLREE